ncbi:MAG: hypothetical protein D6757_02350 [Alphaproteobacteria bacterium]|nr:MAG: hypothetical protein D6757_02350 [Alphaproteobacteria bacterium]
MTRQGRERNDMAKTWLVGSGKWAALATLLLSACAQDLNLADSVVDANRDASEAVALTPQVEVLRERVENIDRAQSRLFQQINALAGQINDLRAEDARLLQKLEELAARDAAEAEKARRGRISLSGRITALKKRVEEVLKVAIEARNGLSEIRRELAGADAQAGAEPSAWGLHLASYRSRAEAAAGWSAIKAELHENVNGLQANVIEDTSQADGEARFRLVAGPIADKHQAEALCLAIRKKTSFCEVVGFSDRSASSPKP